MEMYQELVLFALECSREFGTRVARSLAVELAPHEEREFEDGEHKIRPLCNVRNQDVFVIQSLYADADLTINDKLCRFLFLLGALRDASAARVTAVVPYLCYARKDRKTKFRDPVTTRYVARLFESLGVDHFISMDVHNLAAYQNAFHSTTTDHLVATGLFARHFATTLGDEEQKSLVVGSPDVGGIKRAEDVRRALSQEIPHPIGSCFLQKHRSGGVVSGRSGVVGDVAEKTVIFVDDMIGSGTTLARAAEASRRSGANRVYAAATHGIFAGDAENVLGNSELEKIIVTDTIPPFRLSAGFVSQRLEVLETAHLFAEAVRRIHTGDSIVELLSPD